LGRYDRALRRPLASRPRFAFESEVWRREHGIGDAQNPEAPGYDNAAPVLTSRTQLLKF
jgi:hypothetical protein